MLQDLPPIANLSLSADQYHLEFVPLDQVKWAAQAALSLGIEVGAFVCLESEEDPFLTLFRKRMGKHLCDRIRIITQYVHLSGRAARSAQIRPRVKRVTLDDLPSLGCSTASAPAIFPDGKMMACCGDTVSDPHNWKALMLGDLNRDSLAQLLDRGDRNCLIQALRLVGPSELARIAEEELGVDGFGRLYERDSICDVCRDVSTNPEVASALQAYLQRSAVAGEMSLARFMRFGERVSGLTAAETDDKP